MTYVITQPCIGEKNGACVDVCPAACIHTTPDAPQNYIDPDICIECEQCVLVCPVDAIFLDKEVPDEWQPYIEVNAEFFQQNKAAQVLRVEDAARMLQAVRVFADRAGLNGVAAVVVGRDGQRLAAFESVEPAQVERAERKAYTALMYGVATHELRQGGRNASPHQLDGVDAARVLMVGGGFPIVDTGDTLGAVGVAGSTTSPDQDILCCQAAVSTLMEAAH